MVVERAIRRSSPKVQIAALVSLCSKESNSIDINELFGEGDHDGSEEKGRDDNKVAGKPNESSKDVSVEESVFKESDEETIHEESSGESYSLSKNPEYERTSCLCSDKSSL